MEVTKEVIAEWKEKYKKVFKTTLDGIDYYYTTLKRPTYIQFLTKQQVDPDFDYEFETLKACILEPTIEEEFRNDLENKSGLGVVLLEQIMLKSGWQQVESEEL